MSAVVPGNGEVGDGVGGAVDGGGAVPVGVAVGRRVGPSVGMGVGVEVVTGTEATAEADEVEVAGWLPHPAIRAAASI